MELYETLHETLQDLGYDLVVNRSDIREDIITVIDSPGNLGFVDLNKTRKKVYTKDLYFKTKDMIKGIETIESIEAILDLQEYNGFYFELTNQPGFKYEDEKGYNVFSITFRIEKQ